MKISVVINKKTMKLDVFRDGPISLVILHGLGARNPVKDFELLVNKLVSNPSFKVFN